MSESILVNVLLGTHSPCFCERWLKHTELCHENQLPFWAEKKHRVLMIKLNTWLCSKRWVLSPTITSLQTPSGLESKQQPDSLTTWMSRRLKRRLLTSERVLLLTHHWTVTNPLLSQQHGVFGREHSRPPSLLHAKHHLNLQKRPTTSSLPRNANLPSTVLTSFYSGTMESVLCCYITVWY